MWGDGVWDIVILNNCGLDSSRYGSTGMICCPFMDLTPHIIFIKYIWIYINSAKFIYIIISAPIVLATFYMAEFLGKWAWFDQLMEGGG